MKSKAIKITPKKTNKNLYKFFFDLKNPEPLNKLYHDDVHHSADLIDKLNQKKK